MATNNTFKGHYVNTNMGLMPVDTYLEIKASEYGYDSYEELCRDGLKIEVENTLVIGPNGKPQKAIA